MTRGELASDNHFGGSATTTITSATTTIEPPPDTAAFDVAQLAAASFLSRYSDRTLEAYRHDLRGFFQWATDTGVAVLGATRATLSCPFLDGATGLAASVVVAVR